jgi:hypothetical protein
VPTQVLAFGAGWVALVYMIHGQATICSIQISPAFATQWELFVLHCGRFPQPNSVSVNTDIHIDELKRLMLSLCLIIKQYAMKMCGLLEV